MVETMVVVMVYLLVGLLVGLMAYYWVALLEFPKVVAWVEQKGVLQVGAMVAELVDGMADRMAALWVEK